MFFRAQLLLYRTYMSSHLFAEGSFEIMAIFLALKTRLLLTHCFRGLLCAIVDHY
jgi:hypothetical protein